MVKHEPTTEGLAFGIMSGVITVLGVLIGLSVTGMNSIAGLGIIVVGIADAFSDAAGIYVSEESEGVHNTMDMLKSAGFAFMAKIAGYVSRYIFVGRDI